MKKKTEITFRSPKNKYFAALSFSKAIPGLGSCFSFGAMDLAVLESMVATEVKRLGKGKNLAYITIRENRLTYPAHDWVVVKNYKL